MKRQFRKARQSKVCIRIYQDGQLLLVGAMYCLYYYTLWWQARSPITRCFLLYLCYSYISFLTARQEECYRRCSSHSNQQLKRVQPTGVSTSLLGILTHTEGPWVEAYETRCVTWGFNSWFWLAHGDLSILLSIHSFRPVRWTLTTSLYNLCASVLWSCPSTTSDSEISILSIISLTSSSDSNIIFLQQ